MSNNILLVEDDPDLREDVATFLRFCGYLVHECGSLAQARTAIGRSTPNAAIIDVMLPDGSGLTLLPLLESAAPRCANLIVSARSDIELKLDAYKQGAWSYLVKPVDLRELVGLLGVTLKRQGTAERGGWVLSTNSLEIQGPGGASCALSLQDVALLRALALSRDRFATRKALIESLGYSYAEYDEQRLEALISRLRRKLAPLGENPIKAEHGRGYVFIQPLRLS